MKKMKRLVAVLLAGVMVLAMLTACGCGSSTPTIDAEKVEALYMDIYNAALGADASVVPPCFRIPVSPSEIELIPCVVAFST